MSGEQDGCFFQVVFSFPGYDTADFSVPDPVSLLFQKAQPLPGKRRSRKPARYCFRPAARSSRAAVFFLPAAAASAAFCPEEIQDHILSSGSSRPLMVTASQRLSIQIIYLQTIP